MQAVCTGAFTLISRQFRVISHDKQKKKSDQRARGD
jgi:hypothetical protein